MSAERDCRVRRQAFLQHSQPTVQIAQLDEGAADERRGPVHLLRNPVRVAHDRELLVGPLDVARRAAGEMHEDLEEQREGQWLRVIDRARVGDRSLHHGQARVRETRAAWLFATARSGRRCRARCRFARPWRRGTPDRTWSTRSRGAGARLRARPGERARPPPTIHQSSADADRRGARKAPASPARCHGRCGSRPRPCGAPTCR